ncbi:hypothetical protein Q5752_003507 [Cryptotrichosporon argae]
MSDLADALDLGPSSSTSRIALHVPPGLLVLPPAAALAGALIGMSRGGTRAKLRFLAENAHRQPKTVQGWYFYTKTRNYRVFFGALRTGGRYALGFGAAGAAYVCVDEGVGWARERVFHPELHARPADASVTADADAGEGEGESEGAAGGARRNSVGERAARGWRRGPVHWEDGAAAGGLLAGIGGVTYGLPNPLLVRALVLGVTLGSLESFLQIAQAKIGALRTNTEAQAAADAAAAARLAEGRGAGQQNAAIAAPAAPAAMAEVEQAITLPVRRADELPADTEGEILAGKKSWWDWVRGR